MPLLTVDIKTIAVDVAPERASATIESSAPSWVDSSTILLTDARLEIGPSGTATADLAPTPEGVMYQVRITYRRRGSGEKTEWRSGWFSFTEDGNLADLATVNVPAPPSTPLLDHEAATTDVHGIADTALLETKAGAQARADAAQEAAEETAGTALAGHTGAAAGAHPASAITYAGSPALAAGTVEGALDGLDLRTSVQAVGATDINTLTTQGVYFATAAAPNNIVASAAFVWVDRIGNNVFQRIAISNQASNYLAYERASIDGGTSWSAWKRLAALDQIVASLINYGGGQSLPPGSIEAALDALDLRSFETILSAAATDLNSVVTPGSYFVDGAATNTPVSSAGHVLVLGTANGNYQTQVFFTHTTGSIYQRRRYVTAGPTYVWTDWDRVATTALTNTFTASQRIETSGAALYLRRTNGAVNARDWALYGEVDGSIILSPTSDAGAVNGDNFRIYRDGSFGTGGSSGYVRQFKGTGNPNGIVTAPVGSTFVNTETGGYNGAKTWRKVSGTGNTGWAVENGDTGWRKSEASWYLNGALPGDGGLSDTKVKRIGDTVYLQIGVTIPSGWVSGNHFLKIPGTGFNFDSNISYLPGAAYTGAPATITNVGSAGLRWYHPLAANTYRFYFVLPTTESWPITLPGTP